MSVKIPGRPSESASYPKQLKRMTRVFNFIAALFVLRALLIIQAREFAADLIFPLALAVAFYTGGVLINFLIDLDERVRYTRVIQEQQNKVLTEIRQRLSQGESIETLPYQ